MYSYIQEMYMISETRTRFVPERVLGKLSTVAPAVVRSVLEHTGG